jgi:hypothetical protein
MEIAKLVNIDNKNICNQTPDKRCVVNDKKTDNATSKQKKCETNANLEINGNANLAKDEYYCEICEYKCDRKYNFQMHLNSNKHQTKANINNDINNPTKKLKTFKKIRQFDKAKDGKYYIDSVVYNKLFGTREEVWGGTAYKTSGGLVKNDLMISISQNCIGKIVSKAKSRMEKKISYNRFEKKEKSDD